MSWIKKATILGIVFFTAIFLIKPIGVSTQFSVLSGIIHKSIDNDIIWQDMNTESGYASSNEYYNKSNGKLAKAIENPWDYDFIFVLSIPLGAFIGSYIYKKDKPERHKYNVPKQSMWKLFIPSFLSGFFLLYGARMADGCTSGHMMSGIMQGSLSGYIFAGSVFAVAIPMAIFIGKIRGYDRR